MKTIIAGIVIIVLWGAVGCVEHQAFKTTDRESVYAIWCEEKDIDSRPITFRLQYLSEKKLSLTQENELCKKAVTKD